MEMTWDDVDRVVKDIRSKLVRAEQKVGELQHELSQIQAKHKKEIDEMERAYERIKKNKDELHTMVKDRDFELLKIQNGKHYYSSSI